MGMTRGPLTSSDHRVSYDQLGFEMAMKVMMTSDIGVVELKKRLSEVLSRVALGHERVAIRRRGRRVAVLVPIEEGAEPDGGPPVSPRGLLAAVGAWEGGRDARRFAASIREARDRAMDREVEPLP